MEAGSMELGGFVQGPFRLVESATGSGLRGKVLASGISPWPSPSNRDLARELAANKKAYAADVSGATSA
eukprot:s315_g15.t1